MSSQSPVVWWYHEVNCEVVGMRVEVVPALGAYCIFFCFEQVICLTWVESDALKCSFLCPYLEKLTLRIHRIT
jgi:hypothetical protein